MSAQEGIGRARSRGHRQRQQRRSLGLRPFYKYSTKEKERRRELKRLRRNAKQPILEEELPFPGPNPQQDESDESDDLPFPEPGPNPQQDYSDDSDEGKPFCKYCYRTDVDLIDGYVCDCLGDGANICEPCLKRRIVDPPEGAPRDAKGVPVCPECDGVYSDWVHMIYEERQPVETVQPNITFMEWLYETRGWTWFTLIGMACWPAVALAIITSFMFLVDIPETALIGWYLTFGVADLVVFIGGYIAQPISLYLNYQEYREYQNQNQNQLQLQPQPFPPVITGIRIGTPTPDHVAIDMTGIDEENDDEFEMEVVIQP